MTVRNALLWSFGGQLASVLALVVALVVLARLLTPEEMGIFAIGQATYGLLISIAALGMGSYILRERELDRETLGTAFAINLVLSILLAVGIYFAAPALSAQIGDERIVPVMRLIAIAPIIGAFELLPSSLLQRELKFHKLAILTIIRGTVNTAVAIAAVLAGFPLMAVAFAAVAASAATALAANMLAPQSLVFTRSAAHLRPMAVFGLKTLAVSGISVAAMRLADPVMAIILGLAALGIYSRASTIFSAIYGNVFAAFSRVLLARLADEKRTAGHLDTVYLEGLRAILAIMWPVMLGIAVLAFPVVEIAFGPEWRGAAMPLAILMAAQALSMTYALHSELFILQDRVGTQTGFEAVRACAGLVLFAIGCQFGLEGAAMARVLEILLACLFYIPFVLRLSGAAAADYVAVLVRALVPTALAIAPAALLMAYRGWAFDVPPLELAAAIALGALLWLGSLLATKHPVARGLLDLLSSIRTRVSPRD